MTKDLLERYGLPYVVEDATSDENLAALRALGFLSAPVVAAGDSVGDMWAGFRPDKINELAKRLEQEGK